MSEPRVIVAMLNAVWQSAAIALVTSFVLRFVGRSSASARCAVWMLAFCLSAALPVIDYALARSVSPLQQPATLTFKVVAPPDALSAVPRHRHATTAVPISLQVSQTALAAKPSQYVSMTPTHATPETAPLDQFVLTSSSSQGRPSLRMLLAQRIDRAGGILFWAWLSVAGILVVRFLLQLVALVRAKLSVTSTELTASFEKGTDGRRSYRVGVSDTVAVPCLLGLIHPVIAIPCALAREIAPSDLKRIVLHESAHVRRYDDWFNLFEQVTLALFFFNPALHYISRCTNLEREIACDDQVIAPEERLFFAECLSTLARKTALESAFLVPGLFAGRRQLLVRIEKLLDRKHNGSAVLGRLPYALMGVISGLALLLAQLGIPVLAANKVITPEHAHQMQAARQTQSIHHHSHSTHRRAVQIMRVVIKAVRVQKRERVFVLEQTKITTKVVAPQPRFRYRYRFIVLPRLNVQPKPIVAPKLQPRPVPHFSVANVPVLQESTFKLWDPHISSVFDLASPTQNASSVALAESEATDVSAVASSADSAATAPVNPPAPPDPPRPVPTHKQFIMIYPDYKEDPRNKAALDAYIKALRAAGYTVLTVEDAHSLLNHDVSVEYARAMRAAGIEASLRGLSEMRDHDVSAAYAKSMKDMLHTQLDWKTLSRLRDHDVSANLAKAMAELNRAQLNVPALTRLADHDVSAEYLKAMAHYRFSFPNQLPDVAAKEITQLRDHDVDEGYIASLAAAGYSSLSARDIIRLHDHCVTADFIQRARRAHNNALLSVDELIRMHDRGQ